DAAEDRARLGGQKQAPRPAVGGVGAALDPARVFHAVDLPHQRHRPDFEEIGEAGLVDPLIAGDVGEGAALRPGQPEPSAVVVETAPEQAGDVMHEKPKAVLEIQNHTPKMTPADSKPDI